MKISKRFIYTLFALLIILNIFFRFPITPHEIGWDSFEIHSLANSVSTFGYVKWLIHPLSIFGLYPYSYASAVPLLLSGISQCTGIDIELTIWLFCMLIGIFSAFTAYLMAGAIIDDVIFKFLVAFVYSTSTGILYFTTWTVSARGLFVVLLPLFIYLLLKCRTSVLKYSTLAFILLIILMATHHLFYFIVPVVISYFVVITFNMLKRYIGFINVSETFISLVLLACFPLAFLIPFFTRTFVEAGSRYGWLEDIFLSYGRFIGIVMVFAVGGFIYLLFKHKKSVEEWFFLITLLFLTPLLYVGTYMKWFFLIFVFILIGTGLSNVAKTYKTEKRKYILSVIVVVLLLSACVSTFYQIKYYTIDEPEEYNERYMDESTYTTALWVKDYTNGTVTANDYTMNVRIYAISKVPTLVGSDTTSLIQEHVNISKLKVRRIPVTSERYSFFFDSPYVIITKYPDQSWYWHALQLFDCDSIDAAGIIKKFDLIYIIENKRTHGLCIGAQRIGPSNFIRSMYKSKNNNIYDSGNIDIWYL